MLVQSFGRGLPAEGLAGPAIESGGDRVECAGAVARQVGPFREVLAQEAVGVLVRASLPRAAWITEVDLEAGGDAQVGVLGHLLASIPGQGTPELLRQRRDRRGDGVSDSLGAVAGQGRPVLDPRLGAVAIRSGKVQQHREPRGALDQRADRRPVEPDDQIPFPVSRDSTILDLSGAGADHDLRGDEAGTALPGPSTRHTQGSTSPQARDEFSLQRAPALDVERLVDRLMGDPHGLIMWEVDAQSIRDLLGTPGVGPAAVSAAAVPTPDPAHLGSRHELAIKSGDRAGEAVLHVLAKLLVLSELGDLRAAGSALRVPLGCRGPIFQSVRAGRGVAAQLPRDRRWCSTDAASDLTYPELLCVQDRDLLPFGERQVTARHRSQRDRRHPASLAEPPRPDRLGHAALHGGVFARHATSDRLPEPDPILATRCRWAPRRPHVAAHLADHLLTLPHPHRAPPPSRGVATTT